MKTRVFRLIAGIGFFVSAVTEDGFDGDFPLTPLSWLAIFVILVCSTLIPAAAQAQVNSWVNTASGTWNWQDGFNWSLTNPPSSFESADFITNSVSGLAGFRFRTVSIDSTTSGTFPGTMTINNLTVSAPGS